jgi:hypothetical protein
MDLPALLNRKLPPPVSRRALLRDAACGFGYLALAGLLGDLS